MEKADFAANDFFGNPDEMGMNVADNTGSVDSEGGAKKTRVTSEDQKKFEEAVKKDSTLLSRLHTLSNSVKCVNTLSSNKIKCLIQDPATTKEDRKVIPVPGFCGYRFQNIGTEPIQYMTEEFTKDANGIYVGTKVQKTAAPGEMFDLSRKYTTIFACAPEFSFTFANGKIVSGGAKKAATSIDERLERPHFTFTADENGVTPRVHDDNIKVMIEDANGNVLPEFEATFGFLYNPTVKGEGSGRQGGAKVSTQELAANSIRMMIEENGLV